MAYTHLRLRAAGHRSVQLLPRPIETPIQFVCRDLASGVILVGDAPDGRRLLVELFIGSHELKQTINSLQFLY